MKKTTNAIPCRIPISLVVLLFLLVIPIAAQTETPFQNHKFQLNMQNIYFITADVDGDDAPDIIAVSSMDGKLLWIENVYIEQENPAIDSWPVHLISKIDKNNAGPMILHASDMDGDQDLDLIVCNKITGLSITFYENSGEKIPTWTPYTLPVQNKQIHFLDTGDIDGDQDIDLLVTGWNIPDGDKVFWFENNGKPFSEWNYHYVFNETMASLDKVNLVDINIDGKLDIVHRSASSISPHWFENIDAPSDTWLIHDLLPEEPPQSVSKVVIFDADQDQDPDLMLWFTFERSFFLFENNVLDSQKFFPSRVTVKEVDFLSRESC